MAPASLFLSSPASSGPCLKDLIPLPSLLAPQAQVVFEELHDERGIPVLLLVQLIELVDGVIKGSLSQHGGVVLHVHDLIVKHREVERQPQPDGVGGLEAPR